mmetsp:Transcript_43457/g.114507  ORF Transcript_43457/g.114507 Transcript_43457/m.114507 type:complete len:88 (-) Transcript_43457:26-289(-)
MYHKLHLSGELPSIRWNSDCKLLEVSPLLVKTSRCPRAEFTAQGVGSATTTMMSPMTETVAKMKQHRKYKARPIKTHAMNQLGAVLN